MTLKISPWVLRVVVASSAVAMRSAENEVKAPQPAPLAYSAVFAGPEGKAFEPPHGSVAQFHVTPDSATFWKTFGALKEAVKQAKTLEVYQGLPRLNGQKVAPAEEAKKALFMVDGEWFHATAQTVTGELREALRGGVFAGVKEREGVKLCGGFHADVLLRWGGGVLAAADMLLCFVCSEVKIYGATGALYGDLSNEQWSELRELLAPWLPKPRTSEADSSNGETTPPARR